MVTTVVENRSLKGGAPFMEILAAPIPDACRISGLSSKRDISAARGRRHSRGQKRQSHSHSDGLLAGASRDTTRGHVPCAEGRMISTMAPIGEPLVLLRLAAALRLAGALD